MVLDSVERVFHTMLARTLDLKEFLEAETEAEESVQARYFKSGERIMVSAVGFIGEFNGIIYLYQGEDLARQLTAGFLGMTEDELEDEGMETMQDVLGELANMIGGTFKNKFCDLGYNCRLTIPSLVCGTSFAIEAPTGVDRYIACFEAEKQPYVTDIMFKPENS